MAIYKGRREPAADDSSREFGPRDEPGIRRPRRHVPVTEPALVPVAELYRGRVTPWVNLRQDAACFAERVLCELADQPPALSAVRRALGALHEFSAAEDYLWAAEACADGAENAGSHAGLLRNAAARLDYYAASSGCRAAALRVSARAVAMADNPTTTGDEALDLAIAALGWASLSTEPPAGPGDECARSRAADASERVWDRVATAWRRSLAEQEPTKRAQAGRPNAAEQDPADEESDEFAFPAAPDEDAAELELEGRVGSGAALVVLSHVGAAETAEGRRILAAYHGVVGIALPLVPVASLQAPRRALEAAYPHAAHLVRAVFDEVSRRGHVALRPTLLVGSPGCGKTSFAEELLHALGVPGTVYSCGGSSDSSLAGTSRRWVTGEPSLPFTLMTSHRTSSPGVVLDELEKAGTGAQNGRLHDVLLGMLEPRSSSRWHDAYLQASVDLSHVVWLATANTLDGVTAPMRDRFRILKFPDPAAEHLPVLAARLLRDALRDRGVDGRWALPLDGVELSALAHAWTGGSLRRLARLVEGVVAERDRAPGLH